MQTYMKRFLKVCRGDTIEVLNHRGCTILVKIEDITYNSDFTCIYGYNIFSDRCIVKLQYKNKEQITKIIYQ